MAHGHRRECLAFFALNGNATLVPPALGEALTAIVYCVAGTVRVARRLLLEPVLSMKLMLPMYVPDLRLFAPELIEKVTVVPEFVACPPSGEAVSQLGTLVIV